MAQFLCLLGVNEGISILSYDDRLSVSRLLAKGFKQEYFDQYEEYFVPAFTKFTPYDYQHLRRLYLLAQIRTADFAKLYWSDVIDTVPPGDIQTPATAYWGRANRAGAITGDEIINYMKWYVANVACIPALDSELYAGEVILLNTKEHVEIAGKYLPVFDGPNLSPDWRAFFGFRTKLELADHLLLLTSVAADPRADKNRQQPVIESLLEQYASFTENDLQAIATWGKTGHLTDLSGVFRPTEELNFYIDGDPSVFGDGYSFAHFPAGIQQHQDFESLLKLLNVTVLKQSAFTLSAPNSRPAMALTAKLKHVLPYWAKWRESERTSGYAEMLSDLELKMATFSILTADELTITYGSDWKKKVSLYFANDELYVLENWRSAKGMLLLTEKLSELFKSKRYQSQLNFLLSSEIKEVAEYFTDEGIGLPPVVIPEEPEEQDSPDEPDTPDEPDHDFSHREPKDYKSMWAVNLIQNKKLIEDAAGDPAKLLLDGLSQNNPETAVCIYHFSQLENAVAIIRDQAIKSRAAAKFKDSAGSGIIGQTDEARKKFARFYFRGKTPTQYYVENLGRAENSMARLGSDPLCPVPVFFVIPLDQLLNRTDWKVSLGSLASPAVEYGNDMDTVSRFDFKNVYRNMPQISWQQYVVSAHQEFLVKDQLSLYDIDYQLAVQDQEARKSLLALLDDDATWDARIKVIPGLYHNMNAKAITETAKPVLRARLSKPHGGQFVLQHSAHSAGIALRGDDTSQQISPEWITTHSKESLSMTGDGSGLRYNLFYHYKGVLWLVRANTPGGKFDVSWLGLALKTFVSSGSTDAVGLIAILKAHPEPAYWYKQPVGGPDGLSLEQHTLAVMSNYLNYFAGGQMLFDSDAKYLLCLALHDIGKPAAIALKNKDLQHRETLAIIDKNEDMLPLNQDELNRLKGLIDGDPLGKYFNPAVALDVKDTLKNLEILAKQVDMKVDELWPVLTVFYQCDAGGYASLAERLFVRDENGKFELDAGASRFKFNEPFEAKYIDLRDYIDTLY